MQLDVGGVMAVTLIARNRPQLLITGVTGALMLL